MAVVVITGASSGIGAATARELAARGHRLVIAARRAERLEALAEELAAMAEVLPVPVDVTHPESVRALAGRAVERFGRLDVWINNAGVGQGPAWWHLEPAELRRLIDTNLTAAILAAQAAVPYMIRQGGGHLINVASVAGHVGVAAVYSATKFGLRGHSEALRRELRPYGIHVSLVSPGFVRTEMTAGYPGPMASAERVARAIARLLHHPRREVVVPGWYRTFIYFNRLAPGLVDRLVARYLAAHRPPPPGAAPPPGPAADPEARPGGP